MAELFLTALQRALVDVFEANPNVVLLGEDVLDPYGGAFKVTKGLSSRYPDRVLTTPISEAALAGLANGMALRGLRPVVEIMFGDFVTLAADQVINHMAKFRPMYCGQVSVPAVIRTPMGGGRGYGPTHSQSLEKVFLGTPHLGIVAPSLFHDPGALLAHAILADDDPVVFLEHKALYPQPVQHAAPAGGLNVEQVQEVTGYPTAVVRNYASGDPDVTLICYGGMSVDLADALRALAKDEIRVLTCLPASLQPLPLRTLVWSACESGRVVLFEEGAGAFGWTAEVAAALGEAAAGALRAPIRRRVSAPTIVPAAAQLERQMLASARQVQEAVWEALE